MPEDRETASSTNAILGVTPRDSTTFLRGLYYMSDVVRYLRATDLAARGDTLSLSDRLVAGWGRRGLITLSKNKFERNRSFIRFPHLITSRMIALLRSYGIRIERIVAAQDYLKDETGDDFPFATRRLWTDDPEALHIYAKINDILVTANKFGQIPFQGLLETKIVATSNMDFDDRGIAVSWEPFTGVEIHPEFLSGAPRIKGRRIQTSQVAGMLANGTSKEDVMWWLDISETQLEYAVRWEHALKAADLSTAA